MNSYFYFIALCFRVEAFPFLASGTYRGNIWTTHTCAIYNLSFTSRAFLFLYVIPALRGKLANSTLPCDKQHMYTFTDKNSEEEVKWHSKPQCHDSCRLLSMHYGRSGKDRKSSNYLNFFHTDDLCIQNLIIIHKSGLNAKVEALKVMVSADLSATVLLSAWLVVPSAALAHLHSTL